MKIMTQREEITSEISDNYKELNGMRPRFTMDHMTEEQLTEYNDNLRSAILGDMGYESKEQEEQEKTVKELTTPKTGWPIGELVKGI
jgi:hypothetical protein